VLVYLKVVVNEPVFVLVVGTAYSVVAVAVVVVEPSVLYEQRTVFVAMILLLQVQVFVPPTFVVEFSLDEPTVAVASMLPDVASGCVRRSFWHPTWDR